MSHLLTLTEASKLIPTRPHVATLTRWILKGVKNPAGRRVRLNAAKAGRQWLVDPSDLTTFMRESAQRPHTPDESDRTNRLAGASKKAESLGI